MIARTLRAVAATAAATVALGMVGTTAAQARPVRPGGITNLTASAAAAATTGKYDLTASWDPSPNATSYRVSVVKGTTLVSTTVKTTSWSGSVTTTPGNASLSVRAVITRKPGPSATTVVNLPDVTAPTGTFVTSKNDATKVGTITQTALSDDSGTAGITRTVDWGDNTSAVTWPSGSTVLTHTYASIGRYVPKVTLTDAASNTVQYLLDAIVLGDVTAPVGSVTVSPGTAWTSYTRVSVTPTALSDDVSPQDFIAVHVAWGDGTSTDSKGTAPLQHVYTTAGTDVVAVTITDEAGNPTSLPPTSVTVSDDKTAPVVRLLLPRAKHSVKAWTTLRGKATDTNGTGVKVVSLRAVEKRGTAWYGYQPATKRWVRAATQAKAFARSRAMSLTTSATHAWAGRLAGLRKGTLVYKVRATDNVGNQSAIVTHKASLTLR